MAKNRNSVKTQRDQNNDGIESKKSGPDGREGWAMVAACFSTTFLLGGSTRSAAVLYIAVMETFGVARGEAAWPISLISGFVNFAGILSGPLSQKIGLRYTCVVGACISVICLIACYFATSIPYLTAFFGILNGIGIGLMYNLNPVILSHYFNRYKGFALGINYCGSTVAAMIFPLLMEVLYSAYGLRGAMLVYGGIMMNTIAISFIMHRPSWVKKRLQAVNIGRILVRRFSRSISTTSFRRNQSFASVSRSQAARSRSGTARSRSSVGSTRERNFSISVAGVPIGRQTNLPTGTELIMATDTMMIAHDRGEEQAPPSRKPTIAAAPNFNIGPIHEDEEVQSTLSDPQTIEEIEDEIDRQLNLREIFCNPIFYLLIVSYMIFTTFTDILLTVMVDLFVDKGIDQSLAINTIPFVSITDMLGRILLPLLADRHFVDRKIMYAVNFLCLSGLAFLIPYVYGYGFITAVFLLVGWFYGSTVVMNTVLASEYLGVHNLAVANGLICSSVGFIAFGRPAFIGFFRDTIGSYNPMLTFWGILCATIGGIWTIILVGKRFLRSEHIEETT